MDANQKRAEPRVRSRGKFDLVIEGEGPITAWLCDVSESGLCLKTQTPVEPGQAVRLDGNGLIADGVVRYCRPEGDLCVIGVALVPVSPG